MIYLKKLREYNRPVNNKVTSIDDIKWYALNSKVFKKVVNLEKIKDLKKEASMKNGKKVSSSSKTFKLFTELEKYFEKVTKILNDEKLENDEILFEKNISRKAKDNISKILKKIEDIMFAYVKPAEKNKKKFT